MATAQNGWPASPNKHTIGVIPFSVNGVSFPGGVKSGDVHTVLHYVAREFDKRVEPLRPGECWGYAYRDVRGGTSLSNHSAACAIDCNAPAHPLGKRGTFSESQVEAIRTILLEVFGVVRWGGNFSRPDEMHFEVVGTHAEVAEAARRLRGTGGTAGPKGEVMTHIPVTLNDERQFRVAFMAEAGTGSTVVEKAWITLSSTWGSTTMTVATLDPTGKVLSYKENLVVRNNTKTTIDIPSGGAIATVEGTAQYNTTVPVVALISKPRA